MPAAEAHLGVRRHPDEVGVEAELPARLVLQHGERALELGPARRADARVAARGLDGQVLGHVVRVRAAVGVRAVEEVGDVVAALDGELVAVGLLEQPVARRAHLPLREEIGLDVLVDAGVFLFGTLRGSRASGARFVRRSRTALGFVGGARRRAPATSASQSRASGFTAAIR